MSIIKFITEHVPDMLLLQVISSQHEICLAINFSS